MDWLTCIKPVQYLELADRQSFEVHINFFDHLSLLHEGVINFVSITKAFLGPGIMNGLAGGLKPPPIKLIKPPKKFPSKSAKNWKKA